MRSTKSVWIACVRADIQVVTCTGAESHSQGSRHVQKALRCVRERSGKGEDTVEKVALEKAKTAAESTASENATREFTARKTDDSGDTSASDAARADRGKATGSSEDDHRQGAWAK